MGDLPVDAALDRWAAVTAREVRREGDSVVAAVHCRYDAPLAQTWNACTQIDLLSRWFAKVIGEPRIGGDLEFDVGAPCRIESKLLQCEPPKILRFTWFYPGRPVDEVEAQFSADGEHSRIALLHHSTDLTPNWWHGAGSGWELALFRLAVLLHGDEPAAISAEAIDQKLGPLWLALPVN